MSTLPLNEEVQSNAGSVFSNASNRSSLVSSRYSVRPGQDSLQNIAEHQKFEKSLPQDSRLTLWQKRLEERRNTHEKLQKAIRRRPGQLVMNSIEELRVINEDKMILDYTSILWPPDPNRGSPSFWTIPFRLPPTNADIPPYEAQLNTVEKCEIPTIEYVSVPSVIQKEKGCLGRSRRSKEQWMKLPCRVEKVKRLEARIKEIQPHKPELNDLVIIGDGLMKQVDPGQIIQTPIITISNPDELSELHEMKTEDENFVGSLTLQVDDIVMDKLYRRNCYNSVDIFIVFNVQLETNNIVKKTVLLWNKGTCTIRYFWKRYIYHDRGLPIEYRRDCFVFNKTERLLLPGQQEFLKFMIKPSVSGIIHEYWQLLTEPNVLTGGRVINFILWCNVSTHNNASELAHLERHIEDKVMNTSVVDTVDYLIHQSMIQRTDRPDIPFGNVTEEELFYIANIDSHTNRPKYFYIPSAIREFRDFYDSLKSPNDSVWNFNIDAISDLIRRQRSLNNRDKYFAKLNQMLKPLNWLPSDRINFEFRKRQLVYNILACTINNIIDEALFIAEKFKIELVEPVYPPDHGVPSVQRINLYKDSAKVLYVNSIPKPLAECFKRQDHVDEFREKYRPPLQYKDRLPQLEELTPMERNQVLKELRASTAEDTKQVVGRLVSVPVTSQYNFHPEQLVSSTVIGEEMNQLSALDEMNLTIYREILYLRTYCSLCNGIDDMVAIIESCNIAARRTTVPIIQRIADAEIATTNLSDISKDVSPGNWAERELYPRVCRADDSQEFEIKTTNIDDDQ